MTSYGEVIGFHGHSCPGLALGYRVSKRALDELGPRSRDEELVAIVENDSCAVDAVQAMTGCTFGKGNLRFLDHGKQAYTFITRGAAPRGIRISIDWTPPEESPEETRAWEAYAAGDRSEAVAQAVHMRKSRKTQAILEAPDESLMRVALIDDPSSLLPAPARIHPSIVCDSCGEKVMSTRIRELGGRRLCIPCHTKETS